MDSKRERLPSPFGAEDTEDFRKLDGRLIGAQAVGQDGADKRILLQNGFKARDISGGMMSRMILAQK